MRIHLDPPIATAVPGEALTLVLVIANESDVERTCRVRVLGLEEPWVEHSDAPLTVPADSELELPIRITLPHGFPRGEQLFGVEVTADGGSRPLLTDAMLSISDLESLHLGLSPVNVRGGWRGRFKLNLENKGTEALTIRLSGRGAGPDDTTSNLTFHFKPESITLRPGERAKTRGHVTGKRAPFGQPNRRALTVTAQGQTAPRHVQGAFIQRPMMPRNVLRLVSLVLILALWAGGLVTTVRMTSDSGEDLAAGQDASAESAAGEEGGADETNGTGTQEEVVPAEGGSIAGQVTGPTDASGIDVILRPVALADDLSEEITLISTSAQEAGKESAQTLRREVSGPAGGTMATVTDADGRWAFGGLKKPANYEVTFAKAGFGQRTYIVTVDDDVPTVALDVALVAGNGALSGRVSGPDGAMGGAAVTVTDGTVTFRTTTPTEGDVGAWSVDGLTTPGTYLISAERRGFGTESTSVTLGSGEEKGGIDLTMVAGVGSIGGRITGTGVPKGGITVTAVGEVTRTVTTFTEDPIGRYALPQLPIPGTYTLTVTGDGWIPQTLAVNLTGNRNDVDLDLVPTTATVIGTVKDATGKPLASTGVTLAQDDPIVKTLSAIDPAGTYELTGLLPGTYTLTFARADFKPESTIVTVVAGDRKTIDMTLTPLVGDKVPKDAVVRGIVRSAATGNPVAGAQVSMNSTVATTDGTGSFVYEKLPPGSYDITFSHSAHQATTRSVRIGAKSDTTIDVAMLTLGGLQGLVTDLTATPIDAVTITVVNDPTAIGQDAFNMVTTSDGTGQFAMLEKFKTGKYVATFTKSGYQTRERNFEIAAGTVVTGDIQLIELGAVFGTIQEPNPNISGGFVALTGTAVTLQDGGGNAVTDPGVSIQVDSPVAGQYRVTGLVPGDYQVTVSKLGYQDVVKDLDDVKLRETRDGSVVLNGTSQTISGTTTYRDANGVDQVLGGVTVSATIVRGYNTLTVFPFIQPITVGITATSDATTGVWSIPALVGGAANGPIGGTTGSYTFSKTGFATRTVSIAVPDVGLNGNVLMNANPRDVTGNIRIQSAVTTGSASITATLSGGNLVTARTQVLTVGNDGVNVPFTFSSVSVGSYTLTFSGTGYQTLTVTPFDVVSGSGTFSAGNRTIDRLGSIALTIQSGGSALNGTSVTLDGGSAATVTGNTTTFNNLAPGNHTVVISKSGYQTATLNLLAAPTGVAGEVHRGVLLAGEAATPLVSLVQWSTLTIHLKSRLDGADTALSGATVQVESPDAFGNTGSVSNVPASGPAGDYAINAISPGNHTITVTAANHSNGSFVISPVAGVAEVQTLAVLANPKIRVTMMSRQTGRADAALPGGSATATVTAGGSGTFALAQEGGANTYLSGTLPVATYQLDASAPGHTATTTTGFVTSPGLTATPTLTLLEWPQVTIDVDSDPGDVALNGATVTALPVGAGTNTPTGAAAVTLATTSGAGKSVNALLPPGRYRINATAASHDTNDVNTVIDVVAGAADFETSITLLRWPQVTITVTSDGTGADALLNGATVTATPVTALDVPTGAAAVTLATTATVATVDGQSVNTNIPPGRYRINATATGHDTNDNTTIVDFAAGDADFTTAVTIRKRPTVTIDVLSDGNTTAALNGATITATPITAAPGNADNGAAIPLNTTANVSGVDGRSVNVSLSPGRYRLTVAATAHDTDNATIIDFAAGDADFTTAVTIRKRPTVTVRVTSRFTSDTLFNGAAVTATPVTAGDLDNGAPVTLSTTGAGGDSVNTSLTPGRYRLTVSAAAHDTNSTTIIEFASGDSDPLTPVTINRRPLVTFDVTSHGTTDVDAAGATVVAQPVTGGGADDGASINLGTTSGVGIAATTALTFRRYRVDVDLAGHDTGSAIVDFTVTQGDFTVPITINKRPDLQVTAHGRVTLPSVSDTALLNATVTATCTAGSCFTPSADVVSLTRASNDTLGVYRGTGLRPGTYTVTVQAPGFDSGTVTNVVLTAGSAQVSLPSGAQTVGQTLLVAENGTITGVVYGLDGNPLAGVTVRAQIGGTIVNAVPASTTATGVFTISGLQPTSWSVTYQKNGYSPLNHTVTVPKGTAFDTGGSAALDAVLVELGGLLQGQTFGLATDDVAVHATDNPQAALADVQVVITGPGGTATQTVSDVGGGNFGYGFNNLPAGTYSLQFSRNGYNQRTVNNISIGVGQALSRTDTLEAMAGTVTVSFVNSVTDVALDGVGVKLTGYRIDADAQTASQNSGNVTPGSGATTFSNIPPGTYNAVIQSVPNGYVLDATPHPVTLAVSATTSAPTVTLTPAIDVVPQGTLVVEVRGLDNAAVAGANVAVTGPTNSPTNITNGSGVATITNLNPGSYNYTVNATGYDSSGSLGPQVIAPGDTATPAVVNLTPAFVTLTVNVTGEGAALSNSAAMVTLTENGVSRAAVGTTATGDVVFNNVRPAAAGFHTLSVTAAGYTPRTNVPVTVGLGPTGATTTVALLAANINVSVDIAGLIAPGHTATVTVRNEANAVIGTASRNGNGNVVVSIAMANLGPTETVTFSAVSDGYSPSGTVQQAVSPGTTPVSAGTITFTPTAVSQTVNFTGVASNTKLVTFDGGVPGGSHSDTISGNSATITNLVPGVLYTITIADRTVFAPNTYTPTVGANPTLVVNITS